MPAPPEDPLLGNLVLFPRLLRAGGIPVSLQQSADFLRALEEIDLGRRSQVFHAARALLVSRRQDLELFRTLFDAFWRAPDEEAGDARHVPGAPAPLHPPRPLAPVNLPAPAPAPSEAEEEHEAPDRRGSWSPDELLRRRDFAELSAEELMAVRRLIERLRWQASLRVTRRLVRHPRGRRPDLRSAVREAARQGGAVVRLERLDRKVKQRPVVVLADVSGSMERYSRLLLQFLYGLSQSLRRVECFVFGTRLSRLTPHLALRNVDQALDQATRQVSDWSGGTRIGASLAAFNRRWGRRLLGRGAVVLILSDGCERGDVARLEREIAHIHRRCHRLLWLNPYAGGEGYEPLVAGMRAVLPHVDDLMPVHNLASLEELADHLRRLPGRGGRRTGSRLLL